MGLFDDVTLDPEVKLPDPQPPNRVFQTKDLECYMHKYRITSDGRLMQLRFHDEDGTWRDHDEEFHGILNFYTSGGDRKDGTWEWFEYNAKFTDGKLVSIERDTSRID